MTIWDFIAWAGLCLLGGYFPTRAAACFLSPAKGRVYRWAVHLVTGVALGMPTWVGDGNPLYYLPAFLAAFVAGYSGRFLARLVVGVIFYEWIMAWSMIVDTRAVLPGSADYWGAVAWKLAMWAGVWLLVRRVFRDKQPVVLSGRLWALLGVLALSPLLSELTFSLWNVRAYTPDGADGVLDAAFYTLLPFVFLSSLALLFAAMLLARHQTLEQEHQLADMRALYYQGLQREQEQVRRLRHDLRNHLTALSGLLEQGAYDRAEGYIRRLQAASGPSGAGRFTDNDTVNIVLSAKLRDMEDAGLTADLAVALPKELPFTDPDLCALFGNALDNAIEAARQAKNKRIQLRARAEKGMLMLRVVNAYAGAREKAPDGLFGTTKSDRRAHGFGLRGMQEIAARYGGVLQATAKDGVFELVACLPLSGG